MAGKLGMIFQCYGKYQLAEICYLLAQELAPRSFRWSYYVGIVEAWSGKNAEGIRDIRGAVKIDGKYGPARVRLGQLLFETGDPDQSLQESVRQNSRLASTSRPGPRAGGA